MSTFQIQWNLGAEIGLVTLLLGGVNEDRERNIYLLLYRVTLSALGIKEPLNSSHTIFTAVTAMHCVFSGIQAVLFGSFYDTS